MLRQIKQIFINSHQIIIFHFSLCHYLIWTKIIFECVSVLSYFFFHLMLKITSSWFRSLFYFYNFLNEFIHIKIISTFFHLILLFFFLDRVYRKLKTFSIMIGICALKFFILWRHWSTIIIIFCFMILT